jgi:subtilisin family serine protease
VLQDGIYSYTETGLGVDAYVIDSGIRSTHTEFTGRVASGQNFSPDQSSTNTSDCLGHGTHVSGILGGTTYGVAKQVTLIPVRVFDCTGSAPMSQIFQGTRPQSCLHHAGLINPL